MIQSNAVGRVSRLMNELREVIEDLDGRASRDGERAQQYFEELGGARSKLDVLRSIAANANSDQPDNYVRWLLARLHDREYPDITPEEPEPGRDWSRVEGHLHKPGGKWMYRVFLDYTGERHRGVSGEGPAGWHFDGAAMAKRALARATDNGTSEVTISELGTYWHLFVPNPPQGYPIWAQPDEAQTTVGTVLEITNTLDEIREIARSRRIRWAQPQLADALRKIEEVLSR